MEVTSVHGNYILSPLRSSHRPLLVLSRVSISARRNPRLASCNRSIRRRNLCSASSSDTLVVGKDGKPKNREVVSKKEEEEELGDLKSWMHKNGLPPCKVVLKEKPSHYEKHSPIHYVAASEDLLVRICGFCGSLFLSFSFLWLVWFLIFLLQVGDVAFSVPNSLVVTLERVLGNETIGKVQFLLRAFVLYLDSILGF